MNKPLLPAIDAAGQLREVAFAMLVRDRRPAELDDLARRTGLKPGAVHDLTASLAGAGWLDLDEAGCITGAAGLSLTTGPHSLTLGGMPFRTWCAYDA
jgi:hypothetical protein